MNPSVALTFVEITIRHEWVLHVFRDPINRDVCIHQWNLESLEHKVFCYPTSTPDEWTETSPESTDHHTMPSSQYREDNEIDVLYCLVRDICSPTHAEINALVPLPKAVLKDNGEIQLRFGYANRVVHHHSPILSAYFEHLSTHNHHPNDYSIEFHEIRTFQQITAQRLSNLAEFQQILFRYFMYWIHIGFSIIRPTIQFYGALWNIHPPVPLHFAAPLSSKVIYLESFYREGPAYFPREKTSATSFQFQCMIIPASGSHDHGFLMMVQYPAAHISYFDNQPPRDPPPHRHLKLFRSANIAQLSSWLIECFNTHVYEWRSTTAKDLFVVDFEVMQFTPTLAHKIIVCHRPSVEYKVSSEQRYPISSSRLNENIYIRQGDQVVAGWMFDDTVIPTTASELLRNPHILESHPQNCLIECIVDQPAVAWSHSPPNLAACNLYLDHLVLKLENMH